MAVVSVGLVQKMDVAWQAELCGMCFGICWQLVKHLL